MATVWDGVPISRFGFLTSPTQQRGIPSGLTPEQDVERILPVGRFDFTAARQVYQDLETLQAWGQSPLYVSVDRVLTKDFAAADAEVDRHIVVITDGKNYQFRPSSDAPQTVQNLVESARARQVSVHVLGLAMEDQPGRGNSIEFTQLAKNTDGVHLNLSSSTDLLATLRAIFEPETYQLRDSGERVVDEGVLGAMLRAETSMSGGRWHSVNFRDSREMVWLEGGETLPFYLRPNGQELYAFAYDHDVAASVPLVASAAQEGAPVVRFHEPVRRDDEVIFRVSLQQPAPGSEDQPPRWRWTRRPAEAWVEIVPLVAPNGVPAGQKYIFYDANYEPDKPVPELRLVAAEWPPQAEAASIRVWFKSTGTLPTSQVPLAEIARKRASERIEFRLSPDTVVQLDAGFVRGVSDVYRLRVVERHGRDSSGPGSLKVSAPQAPGLQPARITRQFDEEHGLVVHSFEYPRSAELIERLRHSEVDLFWQQQVHRDAWQLPGDAVVVEISDVGRLLPLATR